MHSDEAGARSLQHLSVRYRLLQLREDADLAGDGHVQPLCACPYYPFHQGQIIHEESTCNEAQALCSPEDRRMAAELCSNCGPSC